MRRAENSRINFFLQERQDTYFILKRSLTFFGINADFLMQVFGDTQSVT